MVLPYFEMQCEKLKHELSTLLSKYYENVKFNIILVNKFTVGFFPILKIDFLKRYNPLSFMSITVRDALAIVSMVRPYVTFL